MTHHNAHHLIPLDLYHIDVKEHILYTSIVATVPLLFLNINLVDYLVANVIILCHSLYTHSESDKKFILPLFIDSKYHKYHHQIGKGNYAVFFNIWDNYMGTRIKLKKKKRGVKDSLKTPTI
jgi:sterol desaturase/sphingolipid hydroxylase (fatty acid hydroxylase superfamily)